MRVLGVDLGESHTGLALSDPIGLSCSPLGIIEEKNQERLIEAVAAAAAEHGAGRIVVGLPRPLSGGTNKQVELVERFVRALATRTEAEVVCWDERFTTKLARSSKLAQSAKAVRSSKLARSRRPRAEPDDAIAACYMLQSYLDAQAHKRGGYEGRTG